MLIFIEYAQCLSLPYIISRIQWRIIMVQSKIIDFHRNRVAIPTEAAGDLLYMYLCNCIQGTLCLEQVLGFCCKYDEMCKVYVMNVIVFCLLNESQTNDRSPTICSRPLLFFFPLLFLHTKQFDPIWKQIQPQKSMHKEAPFQ